MPAVRPMGRQRGPEQGERQGEQGVAEPDQVEVLANSGNVHGIHCSETVPIRSIHPLMPVHVISRFSCWNTLTTRSPSGGQSRATTPRSRNVQTKRRKTDSRRRGWSSRRATRRATSSTSAVIQGAALSRMGCTFFSAGTRELRASMNSVLIGPGSTRQTVTPFE